ncbi:lipid A export permease/ATP-binding protein MsbA [Aliikangiella coralliicola]|uniref:Lipid A export permease/ATP-binding protein MsbA n=1 Tax=Aliikangiella coralliicola TaxID=2592383 RepID=A0A545U8P5_9GAMM|nr:lipid A export permease/ATP-binding protein MsbA [Aliikangiella coralliicola]TQV85836.1 lipid A export permease/ATP-binding protein MsbA [Aliikangiella coralliicola]
MSKFDSRTSRATLKRLLGYVKDLLAIFIIAMLANLIYAAMDVWFIALTEPLMDEALLGDNIELMKLAPLFIIGILLIRGIASIISTYCMGWVGQNVVQRLRQQLVESYISLPCRFFDDNPSGQLISKVTFNTQQVASVSSDAITKLVREGASIIYAVAFLFYTNWRLATIYFIAVPIIALIVAVTSKRFKNVSKNIQNAMGGVTQTSQEIVDGYKVIKTFSGEVYEKDRFFKVANKNRQQNMKLILTKAISVPLIQLIAALAMAVVIYYSAFELENGTLSPGEFVAMVMMMMFILKPLKVVSNLNSVLQQGIAAAQDIFQVIDSEKEKDTGKKVLETKPDSIEFNDIGFSYGNSDKPIIDNVSFSINQGETVALVGRSGSGKSTLTNLLLRFYELDNGEIKFDGTNIEEYKLASLRKNIAYVSQQVTLFNDSVRANIAYAESEVDEEKMIQAAEKAHALEFINQLEHGFDSNVGENGSKLSGGQRQRLAIARAIYKDAPIIILDEATSALDTESERHIQAALDALTENRTTLVIAHRLSTIENADNIIVMDAGKIVEQGDHNSLLEKNGAYARLHALQFSEESR